MVKDGIILIVAILIVFIFSGFVVHWMIVNSKPFTVDDSVKGKYGYAQLGQQCVEDSSNSNSTLLPGYYSPQQCDSSIGLTCVKSSSTDVYGYCRSSLNSQCYTIFDCAPGSTGQQIYCVGGICTNTNLGAIHSVCSDLYPCDNSKGLSCQNGQCLLDNNQQCSINSQCVSGFCDPNSKLCSNLFSPASTCTSNNCVTGFGCSGGYCQPVVKNPDGTTFVLNPGEKGSFCNIYNPQVSQPLTCNSGLVCNFNIPGNNTNLYPSVVGYGICEEPIKNPGDICNSGSGACIPPTICNSGICSAPLDNNGDANINYCGANSSGFCGSGFYCTPSEKICLPNQGYTCNLTNGCHTGNCNSNKIGIYSGTWQYIDLPEGMTPTNKVQFSIYQQLTIDQNNYPLTVSQLLISDTENVWYGEISTNVDNEVTFTQEWINLEILNTSSYYIMVGFKFTSAGNITAFYNLEGVYGIYLIPFTSSIVSNQQIDLGTAVGTSFFPVANYTDWDVDDLYNLGVVAVSNNGTSTTASYGIFGQVPIDFTVNNQPNKGSNWCKYYYDPDSKSVTNFIISVIPVGQTTYRIINPSSTIDLQLYENTNNSVGFSGSHSNSVNSLQLYYASDKSFNYIDKNTEIQIEGYTPEYSLSTNTPPANMMAMGNIDKQLYTLVSICLI
jgi:hypothetical protein